MSQKKLIQTLPFDQYSRQLIVSKLINNGVRPNEHHKALKIIDLGGHKGKTHAFHPNDKVTILDIFDESYKDYIKGDATNTHFSDNSFDVAVSFDVFEHIPREKRAAFIHEALRISSFGVFLAMPIDVDGRVAGAEVLLNDFHKGVYGKEHTWLKEHIEYRIPNDKEIHDLVSGQDANVVSVSTNQIGDWQLMQMLIFASAGNSTISKDVAKANAWYNSNIDMLDSTVDTGYRKVYFISKDKLHTKKIQEAIDNFTRRPAEGEYVTVHRELLEVFATTLAMVTKKHNVIQKSYEKVDQKARYFEHEAQRIGGLEMTVEHLTSELDRLQSSLSWKVSKPLRYLGRVWRKARLR